MSTPFSLVEARKRFSELVNRAAHGEEIVITRRGKRVARLVPTAEPEARVIVLTGAGNRVSCVRPGTSYAMDRADGFIVPPGDGAAMNQMVAELDARGAPVTGVLYLWPLRVDTPAPADAQWKPAAVEALTCHGLVLALQALESRSAGMVDATGASSGSNDVRPNGAARGWRPLRRLLLVTRNAQQVGSDRQCPDFAQAPALGLGRVVAQEQRAVACRMIDLQEPDTAAEALAILQEIACTDSETEVVRASGVRHVPRLRHLQREVYIVDPAGPTPFPGGRAEAG
jgi:prevent-host-death family protein